MPDLLLLTERIRNTIQLGESHFREFKSAYQGPSGARCPRKFDAICRDIAEAVVAFANADGGDLLIGVEDDGTITGVPHSQQEIEQMLKTVATHVHTGTHLNLRHSSFLTMDEKSVLFFAVDKSTAGVAQLSDGRCVRRSGTTTVPASADQILFDQPEGSPLACLR